MKKLEDILNSVTKELLEEHLEIKRNHQQMIAKITIVIEELKLQYAPIKKEHDYLVSINANFFRSMELGGKCEELEKNIATLNNIIVFLEK